MVALEVEDGYESERGEGVADVKCWGLQITYVRILPAQKKHQHRPLIPVDLTPGILDRISGLGIFTWEPIWGKKNSIV